MASVGWQSADFEQLEPEGLDLGEHAVQCGLIGQRSAQHGVLSARLSAQTGERRTHRVAQVAAHRDLVLLPAVFAGHIVTSYQTGLRPAIVPCSRASCKPSRSGDPMLRAWTPSG